MKLYDRYSIIVFKAKYKGTCGEGFKILTPKKFQR